MKWLTKEGKTIAHLFPRTLRCQCGNVGCTCAASLAAAPWTGQAKPNEYK